MGWYDGRGYYGRRHGGGFFIFPLIFVGMMALFFMRGFFFFFLPLVILGLLAFGAFMVFRFMFGQHGGMNQWGYDQKRKNSSAYFIGEDGERHAIFDEDEKHKRYPDETDFV